MGWWVNPNTTHIINRLVGKKIQRKPVYIFVSGSYRVLWCLELSPLKNTALPTYNCYNIAFRGLPRPFLLFSKPKKARSFRCENRHNRAL